MIRLNYRDDSGRSQWRHFNSLGAAFEVAYHLRRLEPLRQFCELLNTL